MKIGRSLAMAGRGHGTALLGMRARAAWLPQDAAYRAARAGRPVGLVQRQSNEQVVPALVSRLGDEDPVVRLAANEELRKPDGPRLRLCGLGQRRGEGRRHRPMRSWLAAPPLPAGAIRPTERPASATPRALSRREEAPAHRSQPTPRPHPRR